MIEPIFTFALIADTHLNPRDGESGSPWESNRLANDRARWAVAALNADRPEFVLHLGDMVHPVPAQASYAAAAARFQAIFGALDAPLHMLPGNHDIGDKPGDWMPAHVVTPEALDAYRRTFGKAWSAFDHRDCRFILHCNPILGSGLPDDAEQWEWLESQLADAGQRRVFFFTHYPLFLTDPEEPEHYDNLAPDVRERLRRLLLSGGVEAVFAAHVHNIFHTSLSDEPAAPMQHVLPCVSALRLDYSYLFRSPPGVDQEHGRNDVQKLGYYLIDVLPGGYRIRFRRTEGRTLSEEQTDGRPQPLVSYRQRLADRPIGVDLRHGWAQTMAIPYSGVVDEFRRKYVHNDYLVTALQEAGLRDLRIPIDDLRDPETRARMRALARFGHRFQVFTIDPPTNNDAALLKGTAAVSAIEIIARPHDLLRMLSDWRAALNDDHPSILASRLWSSADIDTQAVQFAHGIGHGFFAEDTEMMEMVEPYADGVVFRIGPQDDPSETMGKLPPVSWGQTVFYLCLSSQNPACPATDDVAQSKRVTSAIDALPRISGPVSLLLDTLDDHDRGYYPRNGLYDTRFNPRPVARLLSQRDLV